VADSCSEVSGAAYGSPIQPPGKKKVKIRKDKKWVEVDVDGEVKKGRFKYVKFVDDDGLDTYWISPE
jgi:hypothetical protein